MIANQMFDVKSYLKQEMIDVSLAIFKKFDKGNSGFIDSKDLGNMLRLLDFNPTERELRDMIDKLEEDPLNPKGQFTKEGFLVCVSKKSRDPDTIDELLNAFKLFDKEGTGLLEEKELRFILQKMSWSSGEGTVNDGLTDDEMDNFMKEASTMFVQVINDTKFIKYTDFALYLMDMYKPPEEPKDKNSKNAKGKK